MVPIERLIHFNILTQALYQILGIMLKGISFSMVDNELWHFFDQFTVFIRVKSARKKSFLIHSALSYLLLKSLLIKLVFWIT